MNTVKGGPKPTVSPRKNGQRLASALPPQGGFLFIPASFFGFRPFLQSSPIHFNRGRGRLVLNPALGKSHLSFATGLPPRAALCALGLFPALHFATLLFPLEGKRCPTCVVFGYLGNFTASGAVLCEEQKA
jgi:hypothetical protein